MKREELEHVLRASAAITLEHSFVVVGSQAVLLSHPDAPGELLLSNEVDLYPAARPERAELIDGAIGQLSMFHDTFGYYADGVGPETALLRHHLIELPRLIERVQALDAAQYPIERLVAWVQRRAQEAQA